jgi:cellobiose phosphorylase
MYRLIVESLLGLELAVDKLRFKPCLPMQWKAFKLHYRYRETMYHVTVTQTDNADDRPTVWVDGDLQADGAITLVNDLVEHAVRVVVRTASAAQKC